MAVFSVLRALETIGLHTFKNSPHKVKWQEAKKTFLGVRKNVSARFSEMSETVSSRGHNIRHEVNRLMNRNYGQIKTFGMQDRNYLMLQAKYFFRHHSHQATYIIMALNCSIYLMWSQAGDLYYDPRTGQVQSAGLISRSFMLRNFTSSWPALQSGRLHTLITANFSQENLLHLGMNMLGLFFIGRPLEQILGSRLFLRSYMVCGFAGVLAACYLPYKREGPNSIQYCYGASCAVSGTVVLFGLLRPWTTVYLYAVLPMPMISFVGMFLISSLYSNWRHKSATEEGHIGGMITGGLLYLLKYRHLRI